MSQSYGFNRKRISQAVFSAIAGTMIAGSAQAQIQEVMVTATKREESSQDIPVAVQALGQETLEQMGVANFQDYLVQLPGITAGGSGPGQNTIYIRGIASTTPNLTVAGVAGLAPNVSFYLDEQPLTQPGRNLDVYTADMQRVEVLSGPQGTLFGASSQAGAVRMITNKPDFSGTYAKLKTGTSFTKGGEMNNKVEAVFNLPVNDSFALRGVFFNDDQGGYIDNVAGTRTTRESARFRPAGTVRDNGVPVSDVRAGFQAGSDLSDVEFLEADNAALVEEDFNDTTYSGARFSALWQINPDWKLNVSHMRQRLESDGVFFTDPELDDMEIQRFEDDELSDDFHNTAWTFEGRLAMLDVVYTGAFTDRDSEQTVDYTDYMFVGQYFPYYTCDTAVVYPGYVESTPDTPSGTCQAPNALVKSDTGVETWTHEVRFNTPKEHRIFATSGLFYSDQEIVERNDFFYFGSINSVGADNETPGFVDNFPLTNAAATPGDVGNETQGFFSDPGPLPTGAIFRNDVKRTDEKLGVFSEVTFVVVPNRLELIGGARYYDIEVDLEGSANSSFFNRRSAVFGPNAGLPADEVADAQLGGTNISAQFAPDNTVGAPDTASTDGVIYKATVNWTPSAGQRYYFTFSQGFRPGLLNRPGGVEGPGDFTVPFELDTDTIDNFELGWKLDLLDNSLRFNGNAFFADIGELQTTIFDPRIVNLFFSDNAADAEVLGVEGDVTWAPASVPGLTVSGAFSVLDTEITDVLTPTEDVSEGDELAFAPELQGNLRARYEWDLDNGLRAHVMPHLSYSDEAFTDIVNINRQKLDSWVMLGLTAGVSTSTWSAELFVDNLTDEEAELSGDFVFDRSRVTVARPLTAGIRLSYDFN